MKIGVDIRALMAKPYSGVSFFLYHLLTEILKIDRNNQYRLFCNSGKELKGLPVFDLPNVETVISRYPNKIFNLIMQKALARPKLDEFLDVDVFWLPNLNFISLGWRAKKRIATVHDLSFLRYPEFFNAKRNLWHKLINTRKLLAEFDCLAAVSENTKRDLIELFEIPAEKISVIYPGVLLPKAPEEKNLELCREKFGLLGKFFLYLGTLEPRKNLESLIRAFEIFKEKNDSDFRLVISGAKGWKYHSIIKKWQDSNYKNDIILTGYIDDQEKNCLYYLAEAFIFPSYYEGFGLPAAEFAALGKPLIISSAPALPETAGANALLADPFNPSEIGRCLEIVFENKTELNQKKDLMKEFSLESAARKYIELFFSLKY